MSEQSNENTTAQEGTVDQNNNESKALEENAVPYTNETDSGAVQPAESSGSMSSLGLVLAMVLAFGAFFSGVEFGKGSTVTGQEASIFSLLKSEPTETFASTRPEMDEFWEIWDLMEEKFAGTDDTDVRTRLEGAIDGLVDSYDDPYTVYLPPAEAKSFNQNISGNFSGVGMEVGMRNNLVTVVSPLPDTPAEKAGVMAGDVIVSINGSSTEDMWIDEAVSLIRGEQGSVVNLEMYREGEMDFLTIPITRDKIEIPTVKTEEIGDTFILAIYSFNGIVEEEVRSALKEYIESEAETLVIDLRGNPGGYLGSAVSIASYFLPAGKVVMEERFGDSLENEVLRSRGNQLQIFTPENLVVLVDGGSASASEILAGALKDHGVATIMGAQTFGKGSVQELVKLDDGSSLKVTVARWYTPNGVSISKEGLTPDIFISRTPTQRLAGEDPQKDAAVRFLSGEEVVSETFEDEVKNTEAESEVEAE